ncbi:MAG TPA: response regulator [Blastocatellia bacterium]|jgi:CheY-like chemotaxis protein|nr:response regulator [Blastocatellia bacterium]
MMEKAPPTTRLEAQEDSTEATDNLEASGNDPLVLVVDDVVDNIVIISLSLQQAGYRVVTASNGEEAINVATLSNPDIILMDIGMPVLDGLGAARKMRDDPALSRIPIVAVSAFNTDGFLRAAYDVGFNGYLTKPINFDRLFDLIKSLLP